MLGFASLPGGGPGTLPAGALPASSTAGQIAQAPSTLPTVAGDPRADFTVDKVGNIAGSSMDVMNIQKIINEEIASTGSLSNATAASFSNTTGMHIVDIANMAENAMGLTPSVAEGTDATGDGGTGDGGTGDGGITNVVPASTDGTGTDLVNTDGTGTDLVLSLIHI